MSRVIEIKDDFNMSVLYEKSNEQLIVIDFYINWCEPCKRVAPFFSQMSLSNEFSNVGFYKCNGEGKVASEEFSNSVDRYPTFLFLKDMSIVDKCIGTNVERIEETIRKYI